MTNEQQKMLEALTLMSESIDLVWEELNEVRKRLELVEADNTVLVAALFRSTETNTLH